MAQGRIKKTRGKSWLAYLALLPVLALLAGGMWLALSIAGRSGPEEAVAAAHGLASDAVSVEAILQQARDHLRDKEPERARTLLANAIAQRPEEQALHLLLADALMTLGRMEDAYAAYQKAIFIGPEYPEYRHAAGTLAAELGLLKEAERHYAMAQTLDPASAKYPLYRAQMQRQLGDDDAARASLVAAAHLNPDLALAWGGLAALALDHNNLHMALQYIEKAVKLEPHRPVWRTVQAKIHRRLGDAEAALQLLYAVPEEQRQRDASLLQELALCHGALEQPEQAMELYVEAAREAGEAELQRAYAYEASLWAERAARPADALFYAEAAAELGHELAAERVSELKQASEE